MTNHYPTPEQAPHVHADANAPDRGWGSMISDWSGDKQAFDMPWGKLMMWLFLVGDTFIFSIFLIAYMAVRMSAAEPWPPTSEIFAMELFGIHFPLLLIAIMTFILITSSGTMALAVNYGYRKDRKKTFWLVLATALLGASFLGLQAFEWTELIVHHGVRPWDNPHGASQFGAVFFMVTGFHGLHVTGGVIYLLLVARKIYRGGYDREGYEGVEIAGLYWHFVDLVWVFIFAFFYLW